MVSQTDPSQPSTPEEYRRRYMGLKAGGAKTAARNFDASQANPRILPRDGIALEESVPPGWYWTRRISRGETLRLIADPATSGVSMLIWNARDPSERLNPADTIKVQWSARLSRGRLLLSDMGRALCSITDDTFGLHDFIAGCSSRGSDAQKFGVDSDRRNSRENFVLAAAKHGLSPRDIGPCITFFAPVTTDDTGHLTWKNSPPRGGDYVDLRAEMDLIVALSNCPHPLCTWPTWSTAALKLVLWRSPPPPANDYCRSASEEAIRAFENTEAFLKV
jgi:uncharacterized protein